MFRRSILVTLMLALMAVGCAGPSKLAERSEKKPARSKNHCWRMRPTW